MNAFNGERILDALRHEYGIEAVEVTPLHLGADADSTPHLAETRDGVKYFAKLRRSFDPVSVAVARGLFEAGVTEVVAPLPTRTGALFTECAGETLLVYPYVAGERGLEIPFTPSHWATLGGIVARVHAFKPPPELAAKLPQETFSNRWRSLVQNDLQRAADEPFDDPAVQELAALFVEKRSELEELIDHTEKLASILRARSHELVVCHTDLHGGNLLIDGDAIRVVDWDAPILALRERDLMFAGGGQGYLGLTAQEEERHFQRGYGVTPDPVALAYYRYERVIQDLAAYWGEIQRPATSAADREDCVRRVRANWIPGGTLESARRADPTQRGRFEISGA